MDKHIPAAEANRAFSRLIRQVREEGQSFVITAHGKPVARITPCDSADAARTAARRRLLVRLSGQTAADIGPWRRDELYER